MRFEVPAQCTLHFVRVCGLVPGTAWVHAFSKCAHTVVALRPHRIIVPEMKTALISLEETEMTTQEMIAEEGRRLGKRYPIAENVHSGSPSPSFRSSIRQPSARCRTGLWRSTPSLL
jgi:hypothetical protein